MSRQANSANAVTPKAGEAFYLVFTDSNLYTKISKGKSFGTTALQHYRFALDGGGGSVSGCDSYSSLAKAAKSKAAPSLSSFANKARILCQSLASSTPRGLVSVAGDIYPGSIVVGSISGYFPRTTLTYRWYLQGLPNLESSSPSFMVPTSAVGKTLELQVEIKSVGLNSVTNSSAEYVVSPSPGGQDQKQGDSGLVLTPVPTVSGTAQVGSTLTAASGAWDSGVTLTYQWLRNGVAISGATNLTYVLVAADEGKLISIKVTGSKAGVLPVSQTSAPLPISSIAGNQGLVLTPVPTVSGTAQVGSTLTAASGAWDSGVTLTYQWLRNGVAISGATNLTYVLVAADEGKLISIKVTGSKAGALPVSQTSNTRTVSAYCFKPVPTISGVVKVGSTLTAYSGFGWDGGVSYQWLRNSSVIGGAVNRTYVVSSLDKGTLISVRVTGGACGGTRTNTSDSLLLPAFVLTPIPTISGLAQVGSTLTAATGSWETQVVLTFQWFRNETAIPGETGLTYLLTASDLGTNISFRVTGSKYGLSDTQVSASLLVASATKVLTLTPVPSFHANSCRGVENINESITANVGSWDSGVSLSFQWFRNGIAIAGAVYQSYRLTANDEGASLTIRVTGAKLGYLAVTKESSPKICMPPKPTLSWSSPGRVVGNTFTANAGVWESDVQVSYQWFRSQTQLGSGFPWAAIQGATGPNYQLQEADGGESVVVKVTGTSKSNPNYSVIKESDPVAIILLALSSSKPIILGTPQIGSTLTVDKGVWTAGAWLVADWYLEGVLVKSGDSYLIKSSDLGKKIYVKVTGTKANYGLFASSSSSVTVT